MLTHTLSEVMGWVNQLVSDHMMIAPPLIALFIIIVMSTIFWLLINEKKIGFQLVSIGIVLEWALLYDKVDLSAQGMAHEFAFVSGLCLFLSLLFWNFLSLDKWLQGKSTERSTRPI